MIKRQEPYGFILFDPEKELTVEVGDEQIYWHTKFLRAPESLHILVTRRCNLTCVHCFLSAGNPLNDEMTPQEYESLAKQCREMKVFQWALGGGEPILREDLTQIIETAISNDITYTLTTNGALLTAEKAMELRKAGLGFIQISVYNPESPEPWLLEAVKNMKHTHMPFGFNYILTNKSIREALKFIDFAEKVEASKINFITPKPSRRSRTWYRNNVPDQEEVATLFDILGRRRRTSLSITVDTLTAITLIKRRSNVEFPTWGCVAGRRFLTIDADGRCYPCSHLTTEKWCCGSLRKEKLRDVWLHSNTLNEFREEPLPQRLLQCRALEKAKTTNTAQAGAILPRAEGL